MVAKVQPDQGPDGRFEHHDAVTVVGVVPGRPRAVQHLLVRVAHREGLAVRERGRSGVLRRNGPLRPDVLPGDEADAAVPLQVDDVLGGHIGRRFRDGRRRNSTEQLDRRRRRRGGSRGCDRSRGRGQQQATAEQQGRSSCQKECVC